MKFNEAKKTISAALQNELVQMLNEAEDKSQAIVGVIEKVNEAVHEDLVNQIKDELREIEAGNANAEKMGYRTSFSKDEREFYEKLIAKDSVTFEQKDIIPTELIDRTLEDVKKESGTLRLVKTSPAGVKKWLTGSHSGAGAWGALTDKLVSELTATIESINIEVNKAYVLLIVPKAIRELGISAVDRYFSAILQEAMRDVLIKGYLSGNGVKQPVGLTYKLPNEEGTVVAKNVLTNIKGFSPKQLAGAKKTLSNNGKRAINKLYLIANPMTVYEYVDPALYAMSISGAFVKTSKDDIEVIEEPNMEEGKGIFTIDQAYTIGMTGIRVDEYKEIKALDDADLFIGKCYANGRADDDNVAVVFDATKLEEFKLPVLTSAASQ